MHWATRIAAATSLIAAIGLAVSARSAEPLPAPGHEGGTVVEVQRNFGTVDLPPEETRPAPTVRAYDDVYSPPIAWYGVGYGYPYAYAGYPYSYGYPYGRVGIYAAWRGFYRPGLGL